MEDQTTRRPPENGDMPDKQKEKLRIFRFNDDQYNLDKKFPTNYIRTSKYTLITFLPLSLMAQFKRVANIYFLVISVI